MTTTGELIRPSMADTPLFAQLCKDREDWFNLYIDSCANTYPASHAVH